MSWVIMPKVLAWLIPVSIGNCRRNSLPTSPVSPLQRAIHPVSLDRMATSRAHKPV